MHFFPLQICILLRCRSENVVGLEIKSERIMCSCGVRLVLIQRNRTQCWGCVMHCVTLTSNKFCGTCAGSPLVALCPYTLCAALQNGQRCGTGVRAGFLVESAVQNPDLDAFRVRNYSRGEQ